MARYQDWDLSQLTDEQKRIWDEIAAGPRGTMPPPHQIWLTNPAFCDPAQKVGAYCRYGSNLPAALSELAILVVGRAWRADYEWWAHAKLAADAGVSDAIIEAVRTGAEPDFDGAQENAGIVFRTAKELRRAKSAHVGRDVCGSRSTPRSQSLRRCRRDRRVLLLDFCNFERVRSADTGRFGAVC
ncbi:MAG: carboxymuconolactone decarboxylase family protein [Pseudomonadota bacterium]